MKNHATFTLTLILISIFSLSTVAQQDNKIYNLPEDVKTTNPYKRFEYMYKQLAFPYDTIPILMVHEKRIKEMKKIKNNQWKDSKDLEWTCKGPYGYQSDAYFWGQCSGRLRALAVHPNDQNSVYIGAASGGLWKMANGNSWTDVGAELETQTYGSIAIDPNNPDIIYAGSGEGMYFTHMWWFGTGLFKSIDGGLTWETITNGFGNRTLFNDIEVSPFDSARVIASLGSGCFYLGESLENEGIWVSEDAGITWIQTLEVDDAFDIVLHPTDENIVYAAVGGMHEGSGFYISTDKGITWTQSNTGLDPGAISRMHIDISQSDPDILYAVIYETLSGATWAYKSTDGGDDWELINNGDEVPHGNQGFYDLCIAVHPTNPDSVFIGNKRLYKTTDGSSFSVVSPYVPESPFIHVDIHALKFAPTNSNYLYIGTDGGLYLYDLQDDTAYSKNDGLGTLQFYRIASHKSNPDIMMGGTQDNGTLITEDGGENWVITNSGGDGSECFFDPVDPEVAYCSQINHTIKKSVNIGSGNYFTPYYSNSGAWIPPYFLHPEDNNTMYFANKHIIRDSSGQGNFGPWCPNASPNLIFTMHQSAVNPETMIFASGGLSWPPQHDSIVVVKISTDEGLTWEDVTDSIPGEERWISRVVTDPVDENTIYLIRTGFSPGNKVWKTADLGQSWSNISGDLPDLPCNDLFIDPENTHHLYLAMEMGVYRTVNGGETWNHASEGVPLSTCMDFDYVNIDGIRYLRVGTHGRGIYETILPHYCLPDGITFKTQAQIDSFQINYPGCTEIEGDVIINGEDITNLEGLSSITSFGAGLTIGSYDPNVNPILNTLSGLNNVTFIGGSLEILNNYSISKFTGLDNLSSIGEDIKIVGNNFLQSLEGLNNLNTVGGSFFIGVGGMGPYGNQSLQNITALENLVSIGEDLKIVGNDSLINLMGLENIDSIVGSLLLTSNLHLTSLSGLDNLHYIGESLLLGYWAGNYMVGNNFLNLEGLNNLVHIDGNFGVYHCDSLINLSGIDSLSNIGGSLHILSNNNLTSLIGLDNVTLVGGDLEISCNDSLISLTGLENITSINGILTIGGGSSGCGNPVLFSIEGLSNIEAVSIENLTIGHNYSLSSCEVYSICNYLAAPNGSTYINDNAPGCNSQLEVEDACDSTAMVEELIIEETFTIIPNPLKSTTLIQYTLQNESPVLLKILDISGREILTLVNEVQQQGDQSIVFNTSGLRAGLYFCVLKTDPPAGEQTKKIIKL